MTGEHVRQRWTAAAAVFGTRSPIVQAGMGGIAGPELAVAVSNAGAVGTVGLYRLPAAACRSVVDAVQEATDKPFGVNVIPEVAGGRLLRDQIVAVLDIADRRISVNVYGLPPPDLVTTVRRHGHVVVVQAGTVPELLDADADVLVVQGTEAGGHLLGQAPLLDLVHTVSVGRPDVPVLAAGGISGPRSLRAALVAGAWGAQVGTAFVVASESRAHPRYKELLVGASAKDTAVTDRFEHGWPGRRHRVLRNPVTEADGPPDPQFVAVDRDARGRRVPIVRGSANVPLDTTAGPVDEMALYAGVGVGDVTNLPQAVQVVGHLEDALLPDTPLPTPCAAGTNV